MNVGEVIIANKKMGERGSVFKVVKYGGQLSQVQSKLADPLATKFFLIKTVTNNPGKQI